MNIFGYSFVSKMFIRIYSDIRSYHFLDTNIFGYSFVSKSIRMSHSAPLMILETAIHYFGASTQLDIVQPVKNSNGDYGPGLLNDLIWDLLMKVSALRWDALLSDYRREQPKSHCCIISPLRDSAPKTTHYKETELKVCEAIP